MAVPADGTVTASVAPVMAPPVLRMQKPPRRVGKQFRVCLEAVPKGKVKIPVGLKNETRLVVAGLPGRKPGGLPW